MSSQVKPNFRKFSYKMQWRARKGCPFFRIGILRITVFHEKLPLFFSENISFADFTMLAVDRPPGTVSRNYRCSRRRGVKRPTVCRPRAKTYALISLNTAEPTARCDGLARLRETWVETTFYSCKTFWSTWSKSFFVIDSECRFDNWPWSKLRFPFSWLPQRPSAWVTFSECTHREGYVKSWYLIRH